MLNQPIIRVEGDFITCTAMKQAEDGKGYILRVCNVSEGEQILKIEGNCEIEETNLAEKLTEQLLNPQNIKVPMKKIKTYRIKF